MLNKLYDMGILGGSGCRAAIRDPYPSAYALLAQPMTLRRVMLFGSVAK